MAANVISSLLIREASILLGETGKAAMHSEETQTTQFNLGHCGG